MYFDFPTYKPCKCCHHQQIFPLFFLQGYEKKKLIQACRVGRVVLFLLIVCVHCNRLEFSNGEREVEKFRMIERHYFRDRLVKSFDFKFGFVPPNTRNSWDVIYDVPLIEDELVTQMLAHPYETRSDSFYFVGGKLIMHNMAEYRYTENSIEAQGKANAENMPDPVASTGSSGASSKSSDSGAGQKRNRGGSKFDDEEEEEESDAGTKFSYK